MRAASVAVTPAKEDFAFSDLWLIIRKRRLLVAGMAIGLAILATANGVHRGKMYTARGEIQIQPGSASEFKLSLSSVLGSGGGSLDVAIESDTLILTSDKVLLTVARTLKLQDNPAFFGRRGSVKAGSIGGKGFALAPMPL